MRTKLTLSTLLLAGLAACAAAGQPKEPLSAAPAPVAAEAPQPPAAPLAPAPAPAAPATPTAPATQVVAAYAAGGVATDPDDPTWESLPEMEIAMSEQIVAPPVGGGSATVVKVRAQHDGEWLAVRLEWADAQVDDAVGVATFRDAAAIGFPMGEGFTSPFMGDAEHPVAIWQWTANADADARGEGHFDTNYPSTEGVWYFPQDSEVVAANDAWRGHAPAEAFTAWGFGTLERAPSESLVGAGAHHNGSWRIVLRRRLDEASPSFAPGAKTEAIFALWDGAANEVNGRKSVTLMWTPFLLEPAA